MPKPAEFHPDAETIKAFEPALVWLRNACREAAGARCPFCTQLVKIYDRTINSSMAYVLILLDRHTKPGESVHVQRFLGALKLSSAVAASGDYAKLRYWKCLEQEEARREDGSPRNGYWRITEVGRKFVRGEIRLPRVAKVFSDRLLRLDDETTVSIQESLGRKFRYADLMGAQSSGLAP